MAVKMETEERKVMVCIIGILIGVLVLGTGIYYLHQENMILNLGKFIQLSALLGHCWRLVQLFG